MSQLPRKVVIVAPNWLGDAVMSLPLVGALSGVEGVNLAVLARPYSARVFHGLDGVAELITVGGGARMGRIRAQARALAGVGADAAVVLPPSFSSALSPWIARIPVRVGYSAGARSGLLTDAIRTPDRSSEHLSQSYVALGQRALGRLGRAPAPKAEWTTPRPKVFDSDRREVGAVLGERSISNGDYAAVVPGATYGSAKSWPWKRFRELARTLSADLPVVLAGGVRERALCEAVADGLPGVHSVAGRTSLGAFFALVRGCRVLVANDSGAPHVAGVLGVPTVVLFGSTSPEWTRPLGSDVTVVRKPVHCSPCFKRTCPTQLECFGGISVEVVVEESRRALGRGPAPKKGVA